MSWCFIAAGWVIPFVGSSATFFMNTWHPGVPSCDEHFIVPQFLVTFALPSNVFVLAAVSFAHWSVHREVSRARAPGGGASLGLGGSHQSASKRVRWISKPRRSGPEISRRGFRVQA